MNLKISVADKIQKY